MNRTTARVLAWAAAMSVLAGAAAHAANLVDGKPADLRAARAIPDSVLGSSHGRYQLRATPVPGIYEVRRGAQIVYMTKDGRYVFTGDLYRIATRTDLTRADRRALRLKLLRAIPRSDMVIFSPPHPKYVVTVFTDIDCGYCRALQAQMGEYNRLGVGVRYLSFPRTGPNTSSWYKAEQVWCSPDPRSALQMAKLGEPLHDRVCANNPVAREYALGKVLGLEGTPGIITPDGQLLPGYLPPFALLAELQSEQASAG